MYFEHFRLPALCFWVMWGMMLGQHSTCDFCDMNVSQAQVTQTCLDMCACMRLCMRAAPLSSPDATPVCLCPEVWEDLSSTASHHLSGFCSSGLSCTCKNAQTWIHIHFQEVNSKSNRLFRRPTCCRSPWRLFGQGIQPYGSSQSPASQSISTDSEPHRDQTGWPSVDGKQKAGELQRAKCVFPWKDRNINGFKFCGLRLFMILFLRFFSRQLMFSVSGTPKDCRQKQSFTAQPTRRFKRSYCWVRLNSD